MASAYAPDLRAQAQGIERKIKTLINETLKQICRVEGLQVSGLKNQLQTRIIQSMSHKTFSYTGVTHDGRGSVADTKAAPQNLTSLW